MLVVILALCNFQKELLWILDNLRGLRKVDEEVGELGLCGTVTFVQTSVLGLWRCDPLLKRTLGSVSPYGVEVCHLWIVLPLV